MAQIFWRYVYYINNDPCNSVQLNADTKTKIASDKKEADLIRLQKQRDEKYNSDVYKELGKLDSSIQLQRGTLDTIHRVLGFQSRQLALSNSINSNVDPIDSLYVKPQLILKDADDVNKLNQRLSRYGYSDLEYPTAGYGELEIRIYLFGPQFSKKQVLNEIDIIVLKSLMSSVML